MLGEIYVFAGKGLFVALRYIVASLWLGLAVATFGYFRMLRGVAFGLILVNCAQVIALVPNAVDEFPQYVFLAKLRLRSILFIPV